MATKKEYAASNRAMRAFLKLLIRHSDKVYHGHRDRVTEGHYQRAVKLIAQSEGLS